jgi:hypothetical protein
MRPALYSMTVVAALATALPSSNAEAQSIGAFTDPTATSCGFQVQPFVPTYFHIVAAIGPQACVGIQGAEFRIDGFPAGWIAVPNADPRLPIGPDPGNPFEEGARLLFMSCQTSELGLVPLMTLFVLPTSPVSEQMLTVTAHGATEHPEFQCPLVILCDSPTFTVLYTNGLLARINSTYWCCQFECMFPPCPPIAVEATTWSGVKAIYATP